MSASPPLSVLLVSQKFPPHYRAGAEMQALEFAKASRALGIEPRILTTSFQPGLPARETVDGLPVMRVRNRSGLGRELSQLWACYRHVGGTPDRYDLLHCQCVSPATLGAAAAARRRRIPVLMRPSIGGRDGEIAILRRHDVGGLGRRILGNVDLFAVLDDKIERDLADIGIGPKRRRRVRNGIDLGRFQPPDAAARTALRRSLQLDDGPVALFAGQLIERKGLADLLRAWPAVRAAVPTATLLVAGSGPLREAVLAAAPQGVRYLGVYDEIERPMQAADLFVMPSYNESFGNVYVEALACGLPTVACATGVIEHLPLDGSAGHVVAAGDVAAIGARLVELLRDPARRAAMGAAATRLARDFDMRTVARDMVALYRETVRLARAT